jgi:hypothetical protein
MGVKNTADTDHSVPPEAAEADHVLLLGPEDGETAVGETCVGLLACDGPDATSVLNVALVDPPGERLEAWFRYEDELPARMEFLSGTGAGDDLPEAVSVTRLSNPRDLPRLGITLVDMMDDLRQEEEGIALCFRSLTVLLQYAEAEQVFRFLHTFHSRIDDAGVRTHFHLDPNVVDETAVATLESLFDAIIQVDEDGYVHVR